MSTFGALSTAVSGLNAQSHAFTDISNNISNSQTVGYKATDTSFSDYVLTSGNAESMNAQGANGTVLATTSYQNQAQGTITSSTNALALAISGNGFFSVDEQSGQSTNATPAFQKTGYFTRDGDFSQDSQGYLVNSSNEYLNGYMVGSNGVLNTTALQPINVSNIAFRPTATTTVTDTATLPSNSAVAAGTGTAGATSQTSTVYDSNGASHSLALNWTNTGSSAWTVSATVDGAAAPSMTANVTFDPAGNLASVTPAGGTAISTGGASAAFTIPAGSGGALGAINVKLGSIGSSAGTTMATGNGSGAVAATPTSDSVTSGTYQGITMTSDGNIMATFDNNQSQLVGKVPLAMFADANALAAHDGQAYTATSGSGQANLTLSSENGAGTLETSSVENSTTNLDTDLTKLITAQQAYGANAKVVTTANTMLQTALSMVQ